MLYSEAAYFDGNHCAHVVAREEHQRLARKHAEAVRIAKLHARSPLRAPVPQADAAHLPLFIAGNEPRLFPC